MTTLLILNDKLDNLGEEMRTQTHSLGRIELHTRSIAELALQDQKERELLYNKLADAIILGCKIFGTGTLFILLFCVAATFRQEFKAQIGGSSIEINQSKLQEKPQ